MSVGHVLSRSVRDSAAFLDLIKLDQAKLYPLPGKPSSFFEALAGKDAAEAKLRIAVQYDHPSGEILDQDCLRAVKQAALLCESLGHQLEEVAHPVDHGIAARAMSRLINVYSYQAVSKRAKALQLELDDCPLETSTMAMVKRGVRVIASDFLDAKDCLIMAERQLERFYQDYDLIIQPVLSKVPAELGWLDMNSADLKSYGARFKAYSGLTALANGTGQPSMSVPILTTESNLPVGAMFTAAWGQDTKLLRLAAQLENAAPWSGLANGIYSDSNVHASR